MEVRDLFLSCCKRKLGDGAKRESGEMVLKLGSGRTYR